MKDTYLTSEDELFYLITLMLVGEDVLEFSSWMIFSLMESLSSMEKVAHFL